jgi:putative two-component system response regulator
MTLTQTHPAEAFTLLLVDDEPDILDSLRRSFRKGFKVHTASSGEQALDILREHAVDLVLSDQRMPGLSGADVLKAARELQPDAIRILLTGYSDLESLISCVNEAGLYKYLSKPWEPEDLRLTVHRALEHRDVDRRLKLAAGQLKTAYHDAVTMLSFACEGKDETTGFHVQRVQHFTEAVALEMGVPGEAAAHMGVMSILHDVGKLYIPDAILKKPAALDAAEWAVMREHPTHGVRILGDNPFYAVAREIAAAHHENWDGSGYPRGLAGEEIPLAARIVKAADVFDALTTRRPYKEPWPVARAIAVLREQSGTQFDPAVAGAFLRAAEAGAITAIMARFDDGRAGRDAQD